MTTELIFNGVLTDLEPAEVCALVACMYDVRVRDQPSIPSRLVGPFTEMKKTAKRVLELSHECHLELDEKQYLAQFEAALAGVVLDWCNGKSFVEVCSRTTVFEGSIIRNLRRLSEVLTQLATGAQIIGNEELQRKFEAGRTALVRGVPFAGSLYLE